MPRPISPARRGSTKPCAATAGIIRLRSTNPSRYVTTDADSTFRPIACQNSGAARELKKGRNKEVSALFSCQLASRHRALADLEGGPGFGDPQRHAAAGI